MLNVLLLAEIERREAEPGQLHIELLAALKAVTATGRAPDCWCDPSHDVQNFGHQAKCRQAQAAIAKAERR